MSPTIYDSSLLTQRRASKAQSGNFINRIQNYAHPNTGYAPALGIYDQSIINAVRDGQMKYYRKGNGVTVVSNGCPCVPISVTNPTDCGTN